MASTYSYKPGDWGCQKCGFVNFAKKTECSKCRTSKPSVGASVAMKDGDWKCPNCADVNFASRTNCRKCATSKLASVQSGMKRLPSSISSDSSTAAPVWKDGDWICPSCFEHNFSSRSTCRKCSASKDGQPQESNINISEESTGDCVICMEKKADQVITVCGHMVLCVQCSGSVDKCPMCRKPFTKDQIIKVFSG